MKTLPRGVATAARLIPAGDREPILGDLLEESDFRGLAGSRRAWWLCGECGMIAAGLTVQRLRAAATVPPFRDVVAGLVVEGTRALRLPDRGTLRRAALFCLAMVTLAYGVEQLVASLLAAGGLAR
jgi:hypothetical protein